MILDRFRLDDRVAIVTGAGKGIGEGTALALGELGAKVVCAARTPADIEDTAARIRELGSEAIAIPCDVSERANLESLVEATMDELGRIDIVINNAGGSPPKPALRTSEKMFDGAFHFNVTTAFLLTRFAVPHMLKTGGGSVVNISSAAGRFSDPGFAAYGTAKAALSHLTKILGAEFAPQVRVNAIAVGSVATQALTQFLDDATIEKMEALTPMGRLGRVEDIAMAALYLASPAASWVTGKIFEIDGGIEASNWPFPKPSLDDL